VPGLTVTVVIIEILPKGDAERSKGHGALQGKVRKVAKIRKIWQ
jgi:hypothetical protein